MPAPLSIRVCRPQTLGLSWLHCKSRIASHSLAIRTDEVLQDLTELTANLATVKGDDVAMLDNLILERRVLCSMSAQGALC